MAGFIGAVVATITASILWQPKQGKGNNIKGSAQKFHNFGFHRATNHNPCLHLVAAGVLWQRSSRATRWWLSAPPRSPPTLAAGMGLAVGLVFVSFTAATGGSSAVVGVKMLHKA